MRMTTTRTASALLALALAAIIGGLSAAPAHADDWHRDRRDHYRHERERRDWRAHRYYDRRAYGGPGYYGYAPPPIIYAPPPPPVAPGVNLFFGFR
jgi:hypothetical protein